MATGVQASPGIPNRALPVYKQPEESKYELDWADLVTLDLSKYNTVGGKQELANQLKEAVHKVEIDRQFSIGRELFALPEAEKLKHHADLEHGNYNGYRPKGVIEVSPGLRDNVEMYNVFKFIPGLERSQPDIVQEHREEIETFQRHIVEDIIAKLLTLIAIVLELPEDTLVNGHGYNDLSDCHLRYMIYHARSQDENAKYQNLYIPGHSDFGSLTLLFRQPIAALQIRTTDGSWKWVKPYPGSITVNIADVLQFWTNGYLKSSIHRVITPPADQSHLDRLGLLYFLRPAHDLTLKSLDSPLLKRMGLEGDDQAAAVKAGDWVRARVKGNSAPATKERRTEKHVLGGLKVKVYD
ncbi:MAG: hypothetical protein M1820_008510 [Bogoriella megaspora]|nr:MAG: hypothetical protein M1820_008510 [Bogoriella megaspora]